MSGRDTAGGPVLHGACVLLAGGRSASFTESLQLLLRDAGVRAAPVEQRTDEHDDVVAVVVCDPTGVDQLAELMGGRIVDRDATLVVALADVPAADADVTLSGTAGLPDLLAALRSDHAVNGGRGQDASAGHRGHTCPLRRLTSREREVIALLVDGTPNHDISTALGISANTVRTHVQNIMTKVGARSRLEVASIAAPHLHEIRPRRQAG